MTERLRKVYEQIDAINAKDPHVEYVNGVGQPKELLYGRRMTSTLEDFAQDPSELLQVAARGQHIKRWAIPRSDYPMDRKGYLKWRTDLKLFHGKLVGDIMITQNYEKEEIKHVQNLLMKKGLKTDPDVQILEDVICLVFLQYYIDDFASTQDDDKMVSILQKTWNKMSENGHAAALKLPLSEKVGSLVSAALKG